jgi:PIN domain nuclease of toxin-antitoxin system
VRYLLDSHVALWLLAEPDRLDPTVIERLEDAGELWFSPVTPWELGIKVARGRLEIDGDLVASLWAAGVDELVITSVHAQLAVDLPDHHRDPFDRMLVAQATAEHLMLVSADRQLRPYDIEVLDPTQPSR